MKDYNEKKIVGKYAGAFIQKLSFIKQKTSVKEIYTFIEKNKLVYHYKYIRKYVKEVSGEEAAKTLNESATKYMQKGDLDSNILK